jgi:hypothetical protein
MQYWSDAEIRNVNTQKPKLGQKTFVLNDVFDPPAAIGVRYPVYETSVSIASDELRPICSKIHDGPFGGVWMVNQDKME